MMSDPQLVPSSDSQPCWGSVLLSASANCLEQAMLLPPTAHMMPLPFSWRSAMWALQEDCEAEAFTLIHNSITAREWYSSNLNVVSYSVLLPKPFGRGIKVQAKWGMNLMDWRLSDLCSLLASSTLCQQRERKELREPESLVPGYRRVTQQGGAAEKRQLGPGLLPVHDECTKMRRNDMELPAVGKKSSSKEMGPCFPALNEWANCLPIDHEAPWHQGKQI